MTERFAIYFAPPPESPIWTLGSGWLGRDARSWDSMPVEVPGVDPARLQRLTASARRYGFHATLKAPFELPEGTTRQDLEAALQRFARAHRPVAIGPLRLSLEDGFLALVPEQQSAALTDFAADAVVAFEDFRAPLSAAAREKRLASPLTPRQVELLERYGYPYVLGEFRFHMTLSDRLGDGDAPVLEGAARAWFAPVLGRPVVLDRISLFREPERGAPFLWLTNYPLGAG